MSYESAHERFHITRLGGARKGARASSHVKRPGEKRILAAGTLISERSRIDRRRVSLGSLRNVLSHSQVYDLRRFNSSEEGQSRTP